MALRITDVGKRFGPTMALDGATFEVAAGEVHALIGENGAGKTTLLNILGGLLRPDRGSMEVEGRPYAPGAREPDDSVRRGFDSPVAVSRMSRQAMSLEVVRRRARFSAVTVSRVLNNEGLVKRTTRARVLRAVEELRNSPNLHAPSRAGNWSR